MATRRMFTGYGNDASSGQVSAPKQTRSVDMQPSEYDPLMESKETFRRRVTPVIGSPEPRPSPLQELLAMLNGSQ